MKKNEIKILLNQHLSLLDNGKIENIDTLYKDISRIKTLQLDNMSEKDRKEILDLINKIILKANEVQEKLIRKMNRLYSSKDAIKAYNREL